MSERPNKQVLVSEAEEARPREPTPPVRFEDATLVERVRSGDQEAFGLLVTKYQEKVYNACWRICGHVEDARDLTQEAFLRAYRSMVSFQEQSSFYTWVFRIAANLAVSHRRKAKVRRARSLDQAESAETEGEPLRERVADPAAGSPAGPVMASELQQQVERALEALDPDHRAVVVLRDLEGFDYAEIARMLEIAPGTVKSRLHRARQALRERLQPYLEMENGKCKMENKEDGRSSARGA